MGLISRSIFREVTSSALLGTLLFTFVLFLQRVGRLFEILVRKLGASSDRRISFSLSPSHSL